VSEAVRLMNDTGSGGSFVAPGNTATSWSTRSPFETMLPGPQRALLTTRGSLQNSMSSQQETVPATLTSDMTDTTTSHELQTLGDTSSTFDDGGRDEHNSPSQGLPTVDGGIQAWRVLLAAFMFEAILWGFPLSFGIFQEYYTSLPEFEGSPFITYIGSIATGIVYMGAPLMAPLVKRFPIYQRHMVVAGWIICLGGMVAGSFADTIGALIVTQGVTYGGKSDSSSSDKSRT
jgi:hypothetical protein